MLWIFVFLMILAGCGEKDQLITIHTEFGDMKLVLYDETPLHKQNFIKLAREGYYDSLLWHRVMKGFMIQGGDNLSRHAKPGTRVGVGGAPYRIPAEIVPGRLHKRGAVAAARGADNVNPEKESNGSQFYIVQGKTFTDDELDEIETNIDYSVLQPKLYDLLIRESNMELRSQLEEARVQGDLVRFKQLVLDARPIVEEEFGKLPVKKFTPEERELYKTLGGSPHLDGAYTVFGEVLEGMHVVDSIAEYQTDSRARPLKDVRMWIDVEEVPRAKISKEYGYNYPESTESK